MIPTDNIFFALLQLLAILFGTAAIIAESVIRYLCRQEKKNQKNYPSANKTTNAKK